MKVMLKMIKPLQGNFTSKARGPIYNISDDHLTILIVGLF